MLSLATSHTPVLLSEVLDVLGVCSGKNYIDCTLGGGGHAEAILSRSAPDGRLVGLDQDDKALKRAGERLKKFGDRARVVYGNFANLKPILDTISWPHIDGVLVDCGISMDQMIDETRGFSFSRDGVLDMRMDTTRGVSAQEFLQSVRESDLADIIFQYGQERYSRRIAKAIVQNRNRGCLESSKALAATISSALPYNRPSLKIHPATKTFQAIRIFVNSELGNLEDFLVSARKLLPPGCRIAMISFHSLEDRLIKHSFREAEKEGYGRVQTKKPIIPSQDEIKNNPASRSAKLRCFEVCGGLA